MSATATGRQAVVSTAAALAREGFTPPGEKRFGSQPAWAALRALGTALWLDTGDLDAARKLWTDDFSNLTTNNTLVNKEVQKGLFDEVIPRAGRALRDADPSLTLDDLVIEVGFVLNCRNALRLVEAFDATVSVELHPAMADNVPLSVEYGRRYFAVNPDRFIVKVPLTPAGFVAARRLSADGVPINFTLGFSARQNVLAAQFSRPVYVNVFMGRLNSFVADNKLGDGENVGEKATLATQRAILNGRANRGWSSHLIGASMRSAAQIFDLAGLDVFTMPTAAAEEYRTEYEANPRPLESQVGRDPSVETSVPEVLACLWDVPDEVYTLADRLYGHDTTDWSGEHFAD
ncbi:MAG TPA: transaldolase family protein, partial [Armatimonadota bacterium]|nr:transaldolase family protein [Armatimonadota bacterium]